MSIVDNQNYSITTNSFKDKIVAALEFVNSFNNILGLRIVKKIQDIAFVLRCTHFVTLQTNVIIDPDIARQVGAGAKDLKPIIQLSSPVGATRLLSIFSVFQSLYNVVNSIVEFADAQGGKKKFKKFFEIVNSGTVVIGNVESIMYGLNAAYSAIQITKIAIQIFAISSLIGTTISFITTSKSIYKTRKVQYELNNISHTDYKTLHVFLNNEKNLASFGIDKKSKFKESLNKLIENKSEITIEDQIKVDILIKDLKGRLKVKHGLHVVSLINNCISLSLCVLTIASIAFPPLLTISIAFALITFIVTTLYDSINNYRFESKMGMIERKPENLYTHHSTLWKVKDFFQWNIQNIIHGAGKS